MSSGVQLDKATSCGAPPKNGNLLPMDLLDEYWFFNNTLVSRKVPPKPPKTPQSNSIDESVACQATLGSPPHVPPSKTSIKKEGDEDDEVFLVPLMRAPSMPSPYSDGVEHGNQKETQLGNNKKSKSSKLRNSSSTLGFHQSWHSAFEKVPVRPSLTRQHSAMSSRNYCLQHNYRFSNSHYRMFQEKKWKSSSDLESIEVQGFKDLGFVFDKKELNENLANVIPGLREKKQCDDKIEEKIARPYLSEAWYVQISPAPSFDWKEKKSTAEMKDQLRFWARAVACNVRQEC